MQRLHHGLALHAFDRLLLLEDPRFLLFASVRERVGVVEADRPAMEVEVELAETRAGPELSVFGALERRGERREPGRHDRARLQPRQRDGRVPRHKRGARAHLADDGIVEVEQPPEEPFGEPLGHRLIPQRVARPSRRGAVPAVIPDRQVDAAVDEELHRLVRVRQEDQMVQDARRLMRIPAGVDICAVFEEEIRHVEVTVDDGPGERRIERRGAARGAGFDATGDNPLTAEPVVIVGYGYWQNESFHNYADYAMTTPFHEGLAELRSIGRERRCAIMCAEAVWWRCHRRIVADYLLHEGHEVLHIVGDGRVEPAKLTPAATPTSDGSLAYPAAAAQKPLPL